MACGVSAWLEAMASCGRPLAVFWSLWRSWRAASPPSAPCRSPSGSRVLAQRLQQARVRRRRRQHVVDQARQLPSELGAVRPAVSDGVVVGSVTGVMVGAWSDGESCQFQNRLKSIFSADGQRPSTASPSTPRSVARCREVGGRTLPADRPGAPARSRPGRGRGCRPHAVSSPLAPRCSLRNDERQDHRVAEEAEQPVLARSSVAAPSGSGRRSRPTARRSYRHPEGSRARRRSARTIAPWNTRWCCARCGASPSRSPARPCSAAPGRSAAPAPDMVAAAAPRRSATRWRRFP